jgi:hypothetical protein
MDCLAPLGQEEVQEVLADLLDLLAEDLLELMVT